MPHLEKGAKLCIESLFDGRLVELTEDELRGGWRDRRVPQACTLGTRLSGFWTSVGVAGAIGSWLRLNVLLGGRPVCGRCGLDMVSRDVR